MTVSSIPRILDVCDGYVRRREAYANLDGHHMAHNSSETSFNVHSYENNLHRISV